MYSITKLSPPTAAFVNRAMGSGLNRSKYFPLAVAYCISASLAIPSEEVTSAEEYYRNNHHNSVTALLSAINEVIPGNSKAAQEAVKKFYAFRVSAAFPKAIPLAMKPNTGVVDFFGLSAVFGDDILKLINESNGELTTMVNGIHSLVVDIRNAQVASAAASQENAQADRYVA